MIAQYNLIKNENKSLKVKQDALVKEKAKLLEKTTLAKARVEAMIARLESDGTRLMSKPVQPVSLNILGKEYKIACAKEEQEALIHSAQELDKQMRKIRDTGKVSGADRIAVLAALNLAHDLSRPCAKPVASDPDISAQLDQFTP